MKIINSISILFQLSLKIIKIKKSIKIWNVLFKSEKLSLIIIKDQNFKKRITENDNIKTFKL